MILEIIVAAGCGWYGATKLAGAKSALRSAVANLHGDKSSLVEYAANRLRARSGDDVRRRAQVLADTPLADVFESATPEEREALGNAFARYCERAN